MQSGVQNIYVTLDGPRRSTDQIDINACKTTLLDFSLTFPGSLKTRSFEVNQGAAQSVLGGLDWIFQSEEFAIVIEDDCLPSLDFFVYILDAKKVLDFNERIFLICGNQFVPRDITQEQWFLSKYPLIWGWATSRERWNILREELRKVQDKKIAHYKSAEFTFWAAGARRAMAGHEDAWDTPLVYVLRLNSWQAILPGTNLVTNIGNDFAATHTKSKSSWIGVKAQKYSSSSTAPLINSRADDWLEKNLYRISKRHLFTTKITRFLDFVGINKKKRAPLLERWL